MFTWKVSVFSGNIDLLQYKQDNSSMVTPVLLVNLKKILQIQTYVFVKTLRIFSRIFLVLTP